MSKSSLLAAIATVAAIVIGGSPASNAIEICNNIGLGSAMQTNYRGYSNKVAPIGAPGTSTVLSGSNTLIETCFDSETGEITRTGRKTTTSENYTNGPGNSNFEKFNPISSTCEATGSLSCP